MEEVRDGLSDETDQSLNARMARRAEEIDVERSEWFPIPGWDDLIEVELRPLPYPTIRKVIKQNEKSRDEMTREIYSMADQLIRATLGFRQVAKDGSTRPIDDDWVRLAQRLPNCPQSPTARQALLFLVDLERIHFLVQDWGEWAKTVRVDNDGEVERDFVVTG
jgi:hypothetical protein